MADAGGSSSCVPRSIDLPFTGICPPSELTCPPCPDTAPYKCPSGGCQANVRDCKPNVVLHGPCNSTTCIESHWCHILPGFTYACWEISPSDHNATLTFSALDEGRCSTCNPLISRYVCSSCCGTRGVAAWTGSYETDAIRRRRLYARLAVGLLAARRGRGHDARQHGRKFGAAAAAASATCSCAIAAATAASRI